MNRIDKVVGKLAIMKLKLEDIASGNVKQILKHKDNLAALEAERARALRIVDKLDKLVE
jgi:hypothetical protein